MWFYLKNSDEWLLSSSLGNRGLGLEGGIRKLPGWLVMFFISKKYVHRSSCLIKNTSSCTCKICLLYYIIINILKYYLTVVLSNINSTLSVHDICVCISVCAFMYRPQVDIRYLPQLLSFLFFKIRSLAKSV